MINREEMITIKFTQDEIEDLLDELISVKCLLNKATGEQIRQLHKDKEPDVQEMYVRVHRCRIDDMENIIDKLMPYSEVWVEHKEGC